MKYLLVSILLLVAINQSSPTRLMKNQQPSPSISEYEKECGDPLRESTISVEIEGKVIEVVEGNAIIVHTANRERKHVSLAGVSDEQTTAARALLTGLALNREVTVLVNPSNAAKQRMSGIVLVQTKDINRELLRAGAARYLKPEPYSMSSHAACVYRMVEKEAREDRRGIWAQEKYGDHASDLSAPDSKFFRDKLGEPTLVYGHKSGVKVQITYDNKDQVCSIFITDPGQKRYPRPFPRLLAVADELVPESSRGTLRDMTRNTGNCIQSETKDYERVFVILNQDACYEQGIRILFKRPSCPKPQKVQGLITWQ